MTKETLLHRLAITMLCLIVLFVLLSIAFLWTCNPLVRDLLLLNLAAGICTYVLGDYIHRKKNQ